ncbi:MAG: helical backbone metal receptor, partial [Bacteroidota bacterium]
GPSVLYLIWQDPVMVVGKHTFINDILEKIGFNNLGKEKTGRYPVLSEQEMMHLQPEVVLLSSEPYPFKEQHLVQYQKIFPQAHVQLVDGELFSWYGSRMVHMPAYFKQLQEEIKMPGKQKLSEPSEQGLESMGPQDSA